MARVEIDANSGFCGGVIKAVSTAEAYLSPGGKRLYSLGSIVHNEEEQARLCSLGLVSVDRDELKDLTDMDGQAILIRAHGEPPSTYDELRSRGFEIIDCTCPVVLKLQKDIKCAYESVGTEGKVLIFGKIGHPEVLGLVGQTEGSALVFENMRQLESLIASAALEACPRIELFSQTTKSPVEYSAVAERLRERFGERLGVHRTICSQVEMRHRRMEAFARSHDVIVFVSGRSSSNGRVLFDLCRGVNARSYQVSGVAEIRREWFGPEDRIGVCGATSTPRWLLEKVAEHIENLQ